MRPPPERSPRQIECPCLVGKWLPTLALWRDDLVTRRTTGPFRAGTTSGRALSRSSLKLPSGTTQGCLPFRSGAVGSRARSTEHVRHASAPLPDHEVAPPTDPLLGCFAPRRWRSPSMRRCALGRRNGSASGRSRRLLARCPRCSTSFPASCSSHTTPCGGAILRSHPRPGIIELLQPTAMRSLWCAGACGRE